MASPEFCKSTVAAVFVRLGRGPRLPTLIATDRTGSGTSPSAPLPAAPAMPEHPRDGDDYPERDLRELLAVLGFARWHSLLLDLVSRYDGWLADYTLAPGHEPDFGPLAEIIEVLLDFAPAQDGDDAALALAITGCDFLARTARDEFLPERQWDPLQQRYRDFARCHRADTHWASQPPWPAQVFVDWALAGLPPRAASTEDTSSAPPPPP